MPPQPGPRQEPRVVSQLGTVQPLEFVLEPGLSLLDAVARPLRLAGFTSAVLELAGGAFGPFAYVLPAAAPDAMHAAWYSAPRTPSGGARLERGCVTFGQRTSQDGFEDWLHCHAVWQEAAGRRGGHILPEESRVAAPITARAWGLGGMGFRVAADPETNFALFAPIAQPVRPGGRRAIALRIRPDEDLPKALAAACRDHGFNRAILRGSLGSLDGACFANGGKVPDYATEFLVTQGRVGPDGVTLSILLADMAGQLHEGQLQAGQNPVCITFEGILEEVPGP
ncbi:MAG: DUF296 domain-containing protein [Acetobacteraceae bacterium]|nr:MAG: DUF296 domain-containing protein [Acetobacteraceae bacterium]